MKENFSKFIVIGDGIMAKSLIFSLKDLSSDITNISSNSFAPACSYTTTAINCLRGTEKGTSKLGDLILESYDNFVEFYNKHNPKGISKTIEEQNWIKDGETHGKWLRRYKEYEIKDKSIFYNKNFSSSLAQVHTEAYIISPNKFFNWIDEKNNISKIDDFIISVLKTDNGYRLTSQNNKVYTCEKLFICTSYLAKSFSYLCDKGEDKLSLEKQKSVHGHYLYRKNNFKHDFILENSFCMSLDFIRLAYRKETDDFVISFVDTNKENFLVDEKKINSSFDYFRQTLNIELGEFKQWDLYKGIRSKGHQRVPFCKEVSSGCFIISGLYKNAFTFSFGFSKKITNSLDH